MTIVTLRNVSRVAFRLKIETITKKGTAPFSQQSIHFYSFFNYSKMQSISTDEESYELTQPHLESQAQEQTHLLKDDSSSSEDEEWAIVDDQQPEMKPVMTNKKQSILN